MGGSRSRSLAPRARLRRGLGGVGPDAPLPARARALLFPGTHQGWLARALRSVAAFSPRPGL
eukprot:7156560-Alexandrium_andersonii.AAC.1